MHWRAEVWTKTSQLRWHRRVPWVRAPNALITMTCDAPRCLIRCAGLPQCNASAFASQGLGNSRHWVRGVGGILGPMRFGTLCGWPVCKRKDAAGDAVRCCTAPCRLMRLRLHMCQASQVLSVLALCGLSFVCCWHLGLWRCIGHPSVPPQSCFYHVVVCYHRSVPAWCAVTMWARRQDCEPSHCRDHSLL